MMKTTLLSFLCSGALALTALGQDPNATTNPVAPIPTAPAIAPGATATPPTAVSASPARDDDDSLEARIDRKVRKHLDINIGPGHHRTSTHTSSNNSDSEDLGALMAIPIVGIIFTTLFGAPVMIVGLIMFFSFWKARSLHRTVRLMVEKGQPVPPELFVTPAGPIRARSDMRRGVVLLMIGVGLMVFLGAVSDWDGGAWALGAIPFLMGAGYLTVWKLEGHKPALTNSGTDNTPRMS